MINFKTYDLITLQARQKIIAIHILQNISRRQANQTRSFVQLIEILFLRNTFLEKSYTKCGEEVIPRHFKKKSKLSIYLDQQSEML